MSILWIFYMDMYTALYTAVKTPIETLTVPGAVICYTENVPSLEMHCNVMRSFYSVLVLPKSLYISL